MGLLVSLLGRRAAGPCPASPALPCLFLTEWQCKTLENFPFLEESQPAEMKPLFSCSIFSETRGQMVIILHVEGKKKISPTIKIEMTSM